MSGFRGVFLPLLLLAGVTACAGFSARPLSARPFSAQPFSARPFFPGVLHLRSADVARPHQQEAITENDGFSSSISSSVSDSSITGTISDGGVAGRSVSPSSLGLRGVGFSYASEATVNALQKPTLKKQRQPWNEQKQEKANEPPPAQGVAYRAVPDPELTGPPFESPYTAPDIPLDYHQQNGTNHPEQVLLAPASPDGLFMFVRFAIPNIMPLSPCEKKHKLPADLLAEMGEEEEEEGLMDGGGEESKCRRKRSVHYGTDPNTLNQSASGRSFRYSFAEGTDGAYVSGDTFFVPIGPLLPSTQYYYQIEGSPITHSFTSLPAPGSTYPFKVALVGDVGQTLNSSTTFDNVNAGSPSLVLFAGDLSYADQYGPPTAAPMLLPQKLMRPQRRARSVGWVECAGILMAACLRKSLRIFLWPTSQGTMRSSSFLGGAS
ncbi:hypothetical protein CLOP_g14724 [Closterium sp. NIES-67]|nr:hypothetical protein CLOP_g14724 [Closterium sp. NIES-67]